MEDKIENACDDLKNCLQDYADNKDNESFDALCAANREINNLIAEISSET